MSYIIKYSVPALICLLLTPLSAHAAYYYTEGHADLQFGTDDTLNLQYKCDGGSGGAVIDGTRLSDDTIYNLEDIIICIPQSTYIYNGTYWYAPQGTGGTSGATALRAPYLGLGTEEISNGIFDDDTLHLTLTSMSAPTGGNFTLEQSGYSPYMDTSNGITADDVLDFPAYLHDHCKWTFTAAGLYKLTFQVSGAIDGETVIDTGTVKVLVGTTVWTGSNGGSWNSSGNWRGGIPGAGSTVIFTYSSVNNQPLTQDIGTTLDLHGIIFTSNAGTYQLGGQTIRLSVDSPEITSESSSDQIIGNCLELAADTVANINGTGGVTLSGSITGSGSLTKSGTGLLLISGTGTYTGNTTVEEGVLALADTGQILDSAVTNDADFKIIAGDHSIVSISGSGDTSILEGSLTVSSIVQDSLVVGAGAKVTIAEVAECALNTVPEPSTWILLGAALTASGSLFIKRRQK